MGNVPAFIQPLYNYPPGASPFWNITKAGGPGNPSFEGGIDIPNPNHTPVYSLGDGTLESAHLFWHNPPDVTRPLGGAPGYGVVCVRTSVPGFGLNDVYYQHIDIAPGLPTCLGGNCNGVAIKKGQLLGWTRGDVGEIEVGVNPAGWGPVWGSEPHPGPQVNPESRIRAMVDADPNFSWGSSTGGIPSLANGFGQQVQAVAAHIGPDASVAVLFNVIDVALELRNPFDVQNAKEDTILGVSFTDPVAWVQEVGTNMIQDLTALSVRVFFIVVGLAVLMFIASQLSARASQQGLDDLGGVQGVMNIAKALA